MTSPAASDIYGTVVTPQLLAVAASVLLGAIFLYFLIEGLPESRANSSAAVTALSKREFGQFSVTSRFAVSGDPARPTIYLTLPVSTSHIPTGSHVVVRATTASGEVVERKYTPIRFDGTECELMFRVYANGALTPTLGRLKLGDTLEMKGPVGLHRYETGKDGTGTFSFGRKRWEGIERVIMLAGGTGLTPMLQIVNHALQSAEDETLLFLLAANSRVADIIMEEELIKIQKKSKGQLKLTFTVSQLSPAERVARPHLVEASMSRGTFDVGTIGAAAPLDQPKRTMFAVCGPPGFCDAAVKLAQECGLGDNVMVW